MYHLKCKLVDFADMVLHLNFKAALCQITHIKASDYMGLTIYCKKPLVISLQNPC